jgi:hypothetical protein
MLATKRDLLKALENISDDATLNICVDVGDIEPVVSVSVSHHPDSTINEISIDFTLTI